MDWDQRRIVVIEDEQDVLAVLLGHLRSKGCRVRGYRSIEEEGLDWSPKLDCIVSDVRLPGINGIELTQRLRQKGVLAPVILITGHGDISMAVQAIKAGAADFCQKPITPAELDTAIERAIEAHQNNWTISDEMRASLERLQQLKPRQREVFDLVAEGLTSKEIGQKLGVSFRTIETHRAAVMERLNVSSLADLIKIKLISDMTLGKAMPHNLDPDDT